MAKDNTPPGAGSPAAPAAPAAPTAVPTFAPPPRLTVPARAALGLDSDSKADLKEEIARIDRQQPSNTLPKPRGKRADAEPKPPKPSAEPAKPAEVPAEPAKPVTPPAAPAAPAAPDPAPQKVKIGGKEYSVEELEKALAEKGKETAPPAAPAAPAAPAKPQEAEDTPEEISRREGEFIQSIIPAMRGPSITDQEYESVLSGGEEGKTALENIFKRMEATALLQARKTAHHDFRPTVEKLMQVAQAFSSQQEQLARTATEQIFLQRHPDFNNQQHLDTARAVAEELFKTYPNEVRQMGLEKFADVVAEHTDKIIDGNFKQWNPSYKGSWKQWAKEQKDAAAASAAAAAAPAAPAAAPAAPPVAPAPAEPEAPAVPPVKPPAANAPVGRGVSGGPASFHKTVAAQLTE